jgi:DNA-binding response OmpR family regulator
MAKILIIEDEDRIRGIVAEYLRNNGFEVLEAQDGYGGMEIFYLEKPDLLILDIMLPGIDGWEICKKIKSEFNTPILMLTAKTQDYDEILGLELGADDYVKKPFSMKVLLLRLKKLLNDHLNNVMEFHDLKIDKESRKVFIENEEINMSPKEYELLVYMAENIGIALSREKILNNVWELYTESDLRTVDTHIKNLRKKIGEEYIETVRGYGYRFEVKK